MPTYHLKCLECHEEWLHTQSIHDRLPVTHGGPVESVCSGGVVQVYGPPAIHGAGKSGVARAKDAAYSKDADAYRRLRRQGLQPQHVRGSAEIETRANEKFEVERNMLVEDKSARRRLSELHREAAAVGRAV
jgi:hypothetical protein